MNIIVGYVVQFLILSRFVHVRAFTTFSKALESSIVSPRQTSLIRKSFLDDWKDFFGGQNSNDDHDDDVAPAGEINIVTIPVKEIKPGGLRLFLMFYLMGLQNTPDKGTWRADQPTSDDYVVDFWYHDNSAVLSVTLSEEHKRITIDRVGSQPSTPYMIQESLVVQGVLDELETMANDPDVAIKDRLLIPEKDNSIETARGSLSFG
jgi:hypothetical protein